MNRKTSTLVSASILTVGAFFLSSQSAYSASSNNSDRGLFNRPLAQVRIFMKDASILSIDPKFFIIKNGLNVYTVQTEETTTYSPRSWGSIDRSQIKQGDVITVHGSWVDDQMTTIRAYSVRDLEISQRHGVLFGKIVKISKASMTVDFDSRGVFTVNLDESTKIFNKFKDKTNLSDYKPGDKLKIKGIYDTENKIYKVTEYVRNFNLPRPTFPTTEVR